MRIFLDTIDEAALGELWPTGAFTGVTTNPLILARSRTTAEEAVERCRRILSDVSGGKTFDEAASAVEAVLSAEADGAWITAGDARRELVSAVQHLRTPGELTPVLQSAHGCQVARLIRVRDAGTAPFDEVQDEVRASVERESRTANLRNLLKELRDKAQVEILDDAGGTKTAGGGKTGK